MRVSVLASGSQGNCTFVDSDTKILIDAGISYKRISSSLSALGYGVEELDAVFITHEHDDHVKGLSTLKKKTGVPVYLNEETFKAIGQEKSDEVIIRGTTDLGDIKVEPVPVSHDAANPNAYVVSNGKSSLGVMTDLGYADESIRQKVRTLSCLVVESNHDIDMLLNGHYPYPLKQRILGPQGHLSNFDASILVNECGTEKLHSVILAHLSKNNNSRELAELAFKKINSMEMHVSQDNPTELIKV